MSSRARTGLLAPHTTVAAPVHEGLRLTIPAREALVAAGNDVELREAVTPNGDAPCAHGDMSVPPSLRRGLPYQLWRVTMGGRVPRGLVPCLIGHGDEQHRGLRLGDEPEYPGEWASGGLAWWDQGEWVPCPSCGAPLVWYEAGYVAGYRVCARAPHHHARLSDDGRSATRVER